MNILDTPISQFSAHYKLLLHLCEEKKMVYLQSCSQKGCYHYCRKKQKLLWYILSKDPLISPDFFHSKTTRQSLFQQEAKNAAI